MGGYPDGNRDGSLAGEILGHLSDDSEVASLSNGKAALGLVFLMFLLCAAVVLLAQLGQPQRRVVPSNTPTTVSNHLIVVATTMDS